MELVVQSKQLHQSALAFRWAVRSPRQRRSRMVNGQVTLSQFGTNFINRYNAKIVSWKKPSKLAWQWVDTKMNFSSFTKIALATIAVSFTSSLANANVCPRLNDAVDLSRLSVDPNGKDYNCNYTPDGMRLKLYKVMLCEQLPSVANYNTTCKPLVDFASGKDENHCRRYCLFWTVKWVLAKGLHTCCNCYFKQNCIKFPKISHNQFRKRWNWHGVLVEWKSSCYLLWGICKWSRRLYKFSALRHCTRSRPEMVYYTYKGLWNPRNPGTGHGDPSNPANIFFINSTPWLSYTGNGKDVHLLSDFNTLASVTSGDGGRNLDDENGIVTDAQYLMGVTKFTTPANINPNTENIDLGFKLKNTFFQKITTNNDYYGAKRCSETHGILGASTLTGAHACLSISYATTFDFGFMVK